MEQYPQRAAAVIIQNDQILLMHRQNNGREYYVFPGGGVENGESPDQAVVRELQEEFTINILPEKELFQIINTAYGKTREEHYFLVNNFTGTPELGGEEKERMDENNQYEPAWISLSELEELPLFPQEAKSKIMSVFG